MEKLYRLEAPYPEIKDKQPNGFYVSLLLNLYASAQSEMTSVLQYVYQAHYFEEISTEIANDLEQIAVVEMLHIKLLQRAMITFGGTPRYMSSRGIYYSARSVDYSKDFASMLLNDISGENGAIKAYRDAADMVSDEDLKALLLRIKADEELHYKLFESILLRTNA